jgi:hypothetical protein
VCICVVQPAAELETLSSRRRFLLVGRGFKTHAGHLPLRAFAVGLLAARASATRGLAKKVPLLVVSTADSGLTFWAQKATGTVASLERIPLGLRPQNALCLYALYVWKIVWPERLAILYPFSRDVLSWRVAAEAALFLVVVTVLVTRSGDVTC